MSRSRTFVTVAIVAVALAGLAWWKLAGRGDAPRYRTAALERGDLTATVSATGTVRPVVQVQVGSQVSGTISELKADYNSRVKAGEVLAQIEPSSFKTRVVQAEAALAKASAALQESHRQFTRSQELLKGDYISQSDVDAAQSDVDQKNADRQQAEALLASARVDLEHTTIRSPIDGVVISRSVDVGQTVAASLQAPELFVIANDLSQMQVETRIDEADIGRIHPDLPVRFTVDAFPDMTFEGKVSQVRLEPITDQNVVTYTTVMRTRNDDLKLRPGMTANVTVLVESRKDVLKVANAALRFRPQGANAAGGGGARRATASGGGTATAAAAELPAAGAGGRPGAAGAEGRSAWHARGRGASAAGDPPAAGDSTAAAGTAGLRHSQIYVLRDGKPVPIDVWTGITDGSTTELHSRQLQPGDQVVIGLDFGAAGARSQNQQLQPPPGMGGMPMRPGGRR